ncbi:Thermolysin metallopeptidase [Fragilaria crotonensis]|nr:Thermolysin metallopeptidase [Fragilaria crotonensis]
MLSPFIPIVTPSVDTRPTGKPAAPRDVQSVSPSSEPSDSQTRIPDCKENETWFQLSIKTDLYPAETEWELRNAARIVTLKGGPYEVANEEYEESKCIPNDSYVFQMKDKYGDGMCCDNGVGSYLLSMDGVELASGGEFGLVEETKIKPRCGTGEARISVNITTDYFGSETSWTLRTLSGSQVMSGNGYKSWETREDTQCIDSSTCYVFTIRDEWGDGMCCNYGVGGYSVKFTGSTYEGSFENGYADAVRIGSSCPVFTILETHRNRVVKRRRRHKANARTISLREADFTRAQTKGLKNMGG